MTDENAILLAHMDGFFDGAIDDGAGTAAVVGTAEYFAKVPKEKRRRTMYFISLPDHHADDRGGAWLHENFKAILAKTALVTNSEHVAVTDSVLDRRWGSNDEPSLIGPTRPILRGGECTAATDWRTSSCMTSQRSVCLPKGGQRRGGRIDQGSVRRSLVLHR